MEIRWSSYTSTCTLVRTKSFYPEIQHETLDKIIIRFSVWHSVKHASPIKIVQTSVNSKCESGNANYFWHYDLLQKYVIFCNDKINFEIKIKLLWHIHSQLYTVGHIWCTSFMKCPSLCREHPAWQPIDNQLWLVRNTSTCHWSERLLFGMGQVPGPYFR